MIILKRFYMFLSLLWFWKSIEIHGFYNLFRWQNMIIQERPMRRSMSTIWSYTSRVRHYKRPRGKGQDMNLARWTWQHLGGGKSTVKALDWGDHGTTLLRRNEHCVQTHSPCSLAATRYNSFSLPTLPSYLMLSYAFNAFFIQSCVHEPESLLVGKECCSLLETKIGSIMKIPSSEGIWNKKTILIIKA